MTEPTDDLRTAIAKPIYDILEGPVNTQDFGRQTRQWEMSLLLADAAIVAYRAHQDGASADLGAAAMLRDPAALHINLLRGNYLTREQLLHLGGEAAQIAAAEATARAMTDPTFEIRRQDGELDEIVGTGVDFHMESLGDGDWWFAVSHGDQRIDVRFNARRLHVDATGVTDWSDKP